MGLMQQAYDTYNYAEKEFCGVYLADAKEPLAPIGHVVTKADIEITINKNGQFVQANAVSSDAQITIMPVTEKSAGRTFSASKNPHALCDQLKYLYPKSESCNFYIEQLEKWESSEYTHPVLTAVLSYVKKGTIVNDLCEARLIEIDEDGNIEKGDRVVRWIVYGIGDESGPCWKNRRLHGSFIKWYRSQQVEETDYCMVSGKNSVPERLHVKGVVALHGNAKLISANDKGGFTYRGRFTKEAEALCIGYETSQKAHNALRWVIANQGMDSGKRYFVCWNPRGRELPESTGFMAPREGKAEKAYKPTAYKNQLRNTLNSWKKDLSIEDMAVTAVFDAATTGRLSLVYYSELQANDFIDRLGFWDETCCWPHGRLGIQSPSLLSIAECAFGTFRNSKYEVDDKIERQVMLQLLFCRIEKSALPYSIEHALVRKAGNLQIVPEREKDKYPRRELLFTTCAVIRKYRYDRSKEEWDMALEPDRKDRSYQFGRLMAVLEKIEKDTYETDEKREPNVIRRQQAFVTKPFTVAEHVMRQLKSAYYPKLSVGTRNFYEKLIEGIMEILSEYEVDLNRPLGDTYLLGYYLQKTELYKPKSKEEDTEEKNEWEE